MSKIIGWIVTAVVAIATIVALVFGGRWVIGTVQARGGGDTQPAASASSSPAASARPSTSAAPSAAAQSSQASTAPVAQCPKDYSLDNGKCYPPAPSVAPVGSAAPVAQCPQTYTLKDGQCYPPAPSAAPVSTPNPSAAPSSTPTPVTPATGGRGQGECEGMNDYGLLGKIETSSSQGTILFQWHYIGEDIEHNSMLPTGRYKILPSNVDGHAWEIGPGCSTDDFLQRHLIKSIQDRRTAQANNLGYQYYGDLVKAGVLEIVYQKTPVVDPPREIAGYMNLPRVTSGGSGQTGPAAITTPANTGTTAPPTGGSCQELDYHDVTPQGANVVTIFESKSNWTVILLWSKATNPTLEHKIYMLAPNQTLPVLGGGGTVINFSCQDAAMARVKKEKDEHQFVELTEAEKKQILR